MKYYQRALISIYSLLTALLALLVLFIALGWRKPLDYLQSILIQQQARWLLAAIAVAIFLLAVKLLFDSFRPVKVTQASVQITDLGEVNITVSALENMIKKSIQSIRGIHNVKPKIRCAPEGIAVFIKVQLAPEMNIPQTTSEMQSTIKEYLETYAGMKLLEARVLVEDAPQEAKIRVE